MFLSKGQCYEERASNRQKVYDGGWCLFLIRRSLPKEVEVMKADPKTEAAVVAVVKQWFEAFANGDMDSVLAFVAPDPEVVIIGTGKDDKCIGSAELRTAADRAFTETKGASVRIGWHTVSAIGSLAWVAPDVTFRGKTSKGETYLPLRYTGVLEQRENGWLIVQSHDSLPTAG